MFGNIASTTRKWLLTRIRNCSVAFLRGPTSPEGTPSRRILVWSGIHASTTRKWLLPRMRNCSIDFCIHREVTGILVSTATTSFIVAHAFPCAYLFLATSFSFSRVVSRQMAASHSVSATSSGRVSAPVGIPNSYVYTGARGRRPRSQRRQTVDQVI